MFQYGRGLGTFDEILQAIDDGYTQIHEYLLKKLPYNRMIRLFRLMTLARLFPYTKDEGMFKEIEKKCYEVMNE
jgi:predicted Rossmann-fold nucleotide-binding protein